jgi:hypothetical protein
MAFYFIRVIRVKKTKSGQVMLNLTDLTGFDLGPAIGAEF